jgi:hypothetical protein
MGICDEVGSTSLAQEITFGLESVTIQDAMQCTMHSKNIWDGHRKQI